MPGVLEATALVKQFRKKKVVNEVSFCVSPGEVVGLLGPNGAGKTTSFNLVVGLLKPDGGQVHLSGQNLTGLPLHRRARLGLGYLPQEASVFRKLSVKQNFLAVLELNKSLTQARREVLAQDFVNERAFAGKAGIGWIGRNQQLIVPGWGSFVALGLLLLDREFEESYPPDQYEGCGVCRNCIEACPAQILGKELFAARDCVSYLTQSKGPLSPEEGKRLGLNIYGCDLCQEVCPYNRQRIEEESAISFSLHRGVDLTRLAQISKNTFQKDFGHTAAGWRGRKTLQRNALQALDNINNKK